MFLGLIWSIRNYVNSNYIVLHCIQVHNFLNPWHNPCHWGNTTGMLSPEQTVLWLARHSYSSQNLNIIMYVFLFSWRLILMSTLLCSRLIGLSESVMLKISKARTITNIQYLNLHGNGLTKVKEVQALPQLKRLIISFNELTRLDELAHMVRKSISMAKYITIVLQHIIKYIINYKFISEYFAWNVPYICGRCIKLSRFSTPLSFSLSFVSYAVVLNSYLSVSI